jgi:hypothetical protein
MPPLRDKPRYERPVSCRFCRSRKLRCSRESPCTNCVSRAIVCELPVPAENYSSSSAAIRSATQTVIPTPNPNPKSNGAPPNISISQPELLERIRKLEALVAASQKSPSDGTLSDVNDIRQQHATQSPESSGGAHTGTPHTPQTHRSRSTLSPKGEGEHLDDDVAWLKSIYTAQDHSVSAFLSSVYCHARLISSTNTDNLPIRATTSLPTRLPSVFVQSSKSHRHNPISIQMCI